MTFTRLLLLRVLIRNCCLMSVCAYLMTAEGAVTVFEAA